MEQKADYKVDPWTYELENVLHDLRTLLIGKHHDYGEGNLREFGAYGILVRASDKIARLKTLTVHEAEVRDETVTDTWLDLAGYAVQALIMLRGEK